MTLQGNDSYLAVNFVGQYNVVYFLAMQTGNPLLLLLIIVAITIFTAS